MPIKPFLTTYVKTWASTFKLFFEFGAWGGLSLCVCVCVFVCVSVCVFHSFFHPSFRGFTFSFLYLFMFFLFFLRKETSVSGFLRLFVCFPDLYFRRLYASAGCCIRYVVFDFVLL